MKKALFPSPWLIQAQSIAAPMVGLLVASAYARKMTLVFPGIFKSVFENAKLPGLTQFMLEHGEDAAVACNVAAVILALVAWWIAKKAPSRETGLTQLLLATSIAWTLAFMLLLATSLAYVLPFHNAITIIR